MTDDSYNHLDQSLTDREQAILQLVAQGLSNEQIATELVVSINTVKWHVRRILARLNVQRRTQAVAVAHALGLIDPYNQAYTSRSRLPVPATPLIGREKEMADIAELLAEHHLVSIIGPGGIGKTRLALAIAHDQKQPVYFIGLESVQDANEIVQATASALGIYIGDQQDTRQHLLFALRNRSLLLVLDNCEHLVNNLSPVREWLTTSPGLKILTTSRERLNLQGEVLIRLRGLAHTRPVSDAAQLFLQSAQRIQPDLIPGDDDLHFIFRICGLLEGIPLAIELAAGWIDMLSPAQIHAEIETNITFLESSLQHIPDRHRSMDAVFAYSWNLLSQEEQAALHKLTVFAGSFDRYAAGSVANASLPTLRRLVDKSLVAPTEAARYRLHELLRQYADRHLRADPDEYALTRRAHCHYYGIQMDAIAQQIKTDLSSFNQSIRKAYGDMDNILAGWHYAIGHPLPDEIGPYVFTLCLLLQGWDRIRMAEQTLSQAYEQLERHPASRPQIVRIRVLTYGGWFAAALYQRDIARQRLDLALQLAGDYTTTEKADLALLLSFRGWVAQLDGQTEVAKAFGYRAVTIAEEAGFAFGQWSILSMLGILELVDGNYQVARQIHERVVRISETHAYVQGMIYDYSLLGIACFLTGDVQRAKRLWHDSLQLNAELLVFDPLFSVLLGCALLAEGHGDQQRAAEILALLIHHPQCGGFVRAEALYVLKLFRARIPAELIDPILRQSEQKQLVTPYLESDFTIDHQLVKRIQNLLTDLQ